MAYTKTNWVDNETPITADKLNNIENGIENIDNMDLISISEKGVIATDESLKSQGYSDGCYIKYSDGTMIQQFYKLYNATLASQWGSLYEGQVNLGNYTIPFLEGTIPNISMTCYGYTCFFEGLSGCTNTHIGNIYLCRPVATSNNNYVIGFIVIGKWK